jgi:hypothetical protein
MQYCLYYQAQIEKSKVWFVVGVLRSFEYLSFDRTIDKENSIFEFFIPEQLESYFLLLMRYFQDQGMVKTFQQLPNRLITEPV